MKHVLCLLLVSATLVAADAPSPLAAMQWIVGDWHATAKAPDGSVTQIDNHIAWSENHAAIYFVTRFNGTPHYSGMYAYDPDRKLIAFWYTDDAGTLTQGTARQDGARWVQDFTSVKADGTKNPALRSYMDRAAGDKSYHWQVVRPADETKPLIALDYIKK